MTTPAHRLRSFALRAWRRLRYTCYGRRAGLGQPVPVEALDHEYASGAWDRLLGPEELARNQILADLIHAAPGRPRLLDIGCGSGRLATLLDPARLDAYLGLDVSVEGLARARALRLPPPLDRFEQQDFEHWTPPAGAFDLAVFNESLGYAPDPLRTARRFAAALGPRPILLVSQYRTTNHVEFWRRLARGFDCVADHQALGPQDRVWDVRALRPRS